MLAAHSQSQHGKEWQTQWKAPLKKKYPRIYRVSLHRASGYIGCLVGDCGGKTTTHTNLHIHFMHRRVWDMLVILGEENIPHPCCPDCGMFVPWAALNRRHPETSLYSWVAKSEIWCMEEEEAWAGAVTVLQSYDRLL